MTNAEKFNEVFQQEVAPGTTGCNGLMVECAHDCDNCDWRNFWDEEYKCGE